MTNFDDKLRTLRAQAACGCVWDIAFCLEGNTVRRAGIALISVLPAAGFTARGWQPHPFFCA